jgi:hypothetical protein
MAGQSGAFHPRRYVGRHRGPRKLKRNQPLTVFVYVNISKPVGEVNHQDVCEPGCR